MHCLGSRNTVFCRSNNILKKSYVFIGDSSGTTDADDMESVCTKCGKNFNCASLLRLHKFKCSFSCEICGKRFVNTTEHSKHFDNCSPKFTLDQIFSKNNSADLCKIPQITTTTTTKAVQSDVVKEKICPKRQTARIQSFNNSNGFNLRQRCRKCEECGHTYSNIVELEKHMVKVHQYDRVYHIYTCRICKEVFSNGALLRKHKNSHVSMYICFCWNFSILYLLC